MPAKKTTAEKGPKSKALSAVEAQAQAEIKIGKWIEMMDTTERMSVGTFYDIPREYMEWHFLRCGIRNEPRAEALAALMRDMGYQPAPRGVKMVGFESDGEGGLYLCIPMQVWKLLEDRKQRAKKRLCQNVDAMIQGHAAQLRGMLGSDSEVTVKGGTTMGGR